MQVGGPGRGGAARVIIPDALDDEQEAQETPGVKHFRAFLLQQLPAYGIRACAVGRRYGGATGSVMLGFLGLIIIIIII